MKKGTLLRKSLRQSVRRIVSVSRPKISSISLKGSGNVGTNEVACYRGVSLSVINKLWEDVLLGKKASDVLLYTTVEDIEELDIKKGTTVSIVDDRKNNKQFSCMVPHRQVSTSVVNISYDKLEKKARIDWTIDDMYEFVIVPMTVNNESMLFIDLMDQKDVGEPYEGVFVCYQRRESKFSSLLNAVNNYYNDRKSSANNNKKKEKKMYIWMDIFCINNHNNETMMMPTDVPSLSSAKQQESEENRTEFIRQGLFDAIKHFDERLIFFDNYSWEMENDNKNLPPPQRNAWVLWELFGICSQSQTLDSICNKKIRDSNDRKNNRFVQVFDEQDDHSINLDTCKKKEFDIIFEQKFDINFLSEKLMQINNNNNNSNVDSFVDLFIDKNQDNTKHLFCSNTIDLEIIKQCMNNIDGGFITIKGEIINKLTNWLIESIKENVSGMENKINDKNDCFQLVETYQKGGIYMIQLHHEQLGLSYLKKAFKLLESIDDRANQQHQSEDDDDDDILDLKHSICYNLAHVYETLNEMDKAKQYYQKSIDICVQLKMFEELANCYFGLGNVFRALKKFEQSMAMYRKCLSIKQQLLLKFDTSIGQTYNNLGFVYYSLKQYDCSLALFQYAIEIFKNGNGEINDQHPQMAESINGCGMVYHGLKQNVQALEKYEQSLDIWKALLGEFHPRCAMSFNNIGIIHGELGDHEKALEYYNKSLNVRKLTVGTNHPDCQSVYFNIANEHCKADNFEEGLKFYEKSLNCINELHRKSTDEEKRLLESIYFKMGTTFMKLSQFEKANEMFVKCKEILFESDDEKEMVKIFDMLGEVNRLNGDFKSALEFYERSISLTKGCVVDTNAASTLGNAASIHHSLGNFDQALELYEECLKVLKKMNPNTISIVMVETYNNMGLMFESKLDYQQAMEAYNTGLDLAKQLLEENKNRDLIIADTCIFIGKLHKTKKEFPQAIDVFEQALDVYENRFGNENGKVLSIRNDLAMLYRLVGDFKTSVALYEDNIGALKSIFGSSNHATVAQVYHDLAIAYENQEEYEQAIKMFTKAENIWKKINTNGNDTNMSLARCYFSMSVSYNKQKKLKLAIKYIEKAIKISIKSNGKDHPTTCSWESIKEKLNKTNKIQQQL